MTNTNLIKQFIQRDRTWLFLCIAVLNLILWFIFKMPISIIVFALLIFSIFDAYGYYYLAYPLKLQLQITGTYEHVIPTYRVIQVIFQIVLCLLVYAMAGTTAMLVFILSWWLGFCDWLYYNILMQGYEYPDMFWLWWTPYGLILKLQHKAIPYKWLNAAVIVAHVVLIGYSLL